MINLKASRKTPTFNVGVNPVTNVHVNNGETVLRYPPSSTPNLSPNPNVPAPPCPGSDEGMPRAYLSPGDFVSVNPAVTSFTPDLSSLQSDDPEKAKLLRENAVLKIIIDIQHNNPIIFNKYIIADDATLVRLVALLCNATEVHIDADDVGRGCMSKNIYRKVHSIYVAVDGQILNLKYNFADVMKTLKDLHISTKYVF